MIIMNLDVIIRLSTLNAICRELQCTPGDILEYKPDEE